jgi:hypothetical protein
MRGIELQSIAEFQNFVDGLESFTANNISLLISGSAYDRLSFTYIAHSRLKSTQANSIVSMGVAIVTSIITLGSTLAASGPAAAAAFGSSRALDDFKTHPFAREVMKLADKGFKFVRNTGSFIQLIKE